MIDQVATDITARGLIEIFKRNRKDDMTVPGKDELLFLALGGAGEIGMNLNLYGHAGKWLMVDLGIGFVDDQARRRRRDARPSFHRRARADLLASC